MGRALASDSDKKSLDENEHSDLLDYLGVSFGERRAGAESRSRLILWKENEAAFFVFRKVAFEHSQWLIGMSGLIGLNGDYLMRYLRLTHTKKQTKRLIDDVLLIASGYVTEANRKKD